MYRGTPVHHLLGRYHATVGRPQGKGRIERFFRTVRTDFLPTLPKKERIDLRDLNDRFRIWVEKEHHETPHRGIEKATPLDRWASCSSGIRRCDSPRLLDDVFLFETTRKVNEDRTVNLNAHVHEVEAPLIGKTVVLRHDPTLPSDRPIKVEYDNKSMGEAPL